MPEAAPSTEQSGGPGWWLDRDGTWQPPLPQPRIVNRSVTPDPEWANAGWQRY
jgi:hypothetical protein